MYKKALLKYSIVLMFGSLLGIIANRNKEYLINAEFLRNHFHFRHPLEKKQVLKSEELVVLLAFGQSNAANYGGGTYKCKNDVLNYYKGEIYQAKEPLLGPDGKGCSVWTRVGDMLIDSGLCKKVLIVPFAIGGTSIGSWVDGESRKKLNDVLEYLREDGIKPSYILWLQGETDNVDKTSKEQYKTKLRSLIQVFRQRGMDAPFFTSITSYFPYNNTNPFGINKQIVQAQLEIAHEVPGAFEGPHTDSLNLAYYRADGVHFTEKGLDILAKKWYLKIKNVNVNTSSPK